jgi:hypothetical protein
MMRPADTYSNSLVINPSGHELDTVLTTSVAIVNILTAPVLCVLVRLPSSG